MTRLLLVLSLLTPIAANAMATDPKDVVQTIFQRASAPDVATDAGKQNEVSQYVDFDTLAKAALGREFAKTSPADFQWFRNTLKEIIARTVYPKAPDFLKDTKITYSADETSGDKAKIRSTVQNKADLTDVDYKLALQNGKDWRVTDVAISGQSWVESIHDEVTKVLKKNKWSGLKAKMNKRLNDLRAGNG